MEREVGGSWGELGAEEVELMEAYRWAPYRDELRRLEAKVAAQEAQLRRLRGQEESDTGLSHHSQWDIPRDTVAARLEKPLQVGKLTKKLVDGEGRPYFLVSLRQSNRYVVELSREAGLGPEDLKEGDRLGLIKNMREGLEILRKLPPKVDAAVAVMEVEERPDVDYSDIGGQDKPLMELREVVEVPLTEPGRLEALGVEAPRGVLLSGPPGTGKTLAAKAVAARTQSVFLSLNASQLLQKYVGEGARLVREIFARARSYPSAIVFIDEIDAIGGARFDDGHGGDSEVQRTMMELLAQMDGFDKASGVRVLMATNRPDTLDPALVRPGRIDRKITFGLPDTKGREEILRIGARRMKVGSGIRWALLSRMAPNATPAELRCVATEAGMAAIRHKRRVVREADFLHAIRLAIHNNARFSSTPSYLTHN